MAPQSAGFCWAASRWRVGPLRSPRGPGAHSCAPAGPNVRKLRPTQGKAAQGSSSESGRRWAAGAGSVGPGRRPVGGRGFLAVKSGKPCGQAFPFRRPDGG